jgi:hypothetical protein
MIYVFVRDGAVVYQKTRPEKFDKSIELPRMIPTPQKEGFIPKLCADFDTGRVWYEMVETVDGARARVIAAIEAHDKSAAVNSFSVGGMPMWLDREERTSLARTIAIAATAGDPAFSMWAPGAPPQKFDIPIEAAGPMLDALELYAKATYNVTQGHIAAVYALATAVEIEAYDYTAEYPDRLEFNDL